MQELSLMETKTSNLGSFWVLVLWKVNLTRASRFESARSVCSCFTVPGTRLESPTFCLCLKASLNSVYKHCQEQRVTGIFHLKEERQKEWTSPGLAVVRGHVSQPHASGITRNPPRARNGWCQQVAWHIAGSVCLPLLMSHSGPFSGKAELCLNQFDAWCPNLTELLTEF